MVFDDLERTSLDDIDVLGCINEYCENLQIKTIIVAYEDKIQKSENEERPDLVKSDSKMPYKEIKEKIVSRTIKCVPEYGEIIAKIVKDFNDQKGKYKSFLSENETKMLNLFNSGKSDNIRSLKCAIQDFQRLFYELTSCELQNEVSYYFFSFVAFVLWYREGKRDSKYSDVAVSQKYPLYYRNEYMLECVKDWIAFGEWNGSYIKSEINRHIKLRKEPEPEECVRNYMLIQLDECVIEEGLPKVVDAAYAGRLSIDEYILLINNMMWARRYMYELPVSIDMGRLDEGISMCLSLLAESDRPDSRVRNMISNEEYLSKEEKDLYDK